MTNSVERIIGESILQDKKEVKIGNKTFHIGKPSPATIIEVSKYIGTLPVVPTLTTDEEALTYVLAYARDCGCIGEIASILVLGKKNLFTVKKLFGVIPYRKIDNVKRLAPALLEDLSNEEFEQLIAEALGNQRIGFFLNIITTLNGANLLRKTKIETTVSGQ